MRILYHNLHIVGDAEIIRYLQQIKRACSIDIYFKKTKVTRYYGWLVLPGRKIRYCFCKKCYISDFMVPCLCLTFFVCGISLYMDHAIRHSRRSVQAYMYQAQTLHGVS